MLKGVLWHQGEYNSGNNTDPDSDPAGYAARLRDLVGNLPRQPGKTRSAVRMREVRSGHLDLCRRQPRSLHGPALPGHGGSRAGGPANHRSNTFCVDNHGLRGRSDQLIHFDAYSQRLLGQRYAAAINGFYSDPHLLYLGGFYTPAQLAQPEYTDPNGDIDGDGLASLLEFAFGTDPSKPRTGSPVTLSSVTIPGEGSYPALTFRRRTGTGAPAYVVEASGDLGTWTANTGGQPPVTVEVGSPVVHGDGFETVTVRHVMPVSAAAKRFLRVKVSQP